MEIKVPDSRGNKRKKKRKRNQGREKGFFSFSLLLEVSTENKGKAKAYQMSFRESFCQGVRNKLLLMAKTKRNKKANNPKYREKGEIIRQATERAETET